MTEREQTILHYRNVANLVVSSIVGLNFVWIHFYGTYRYASVPLIVAHLITDLPFASGDLFVHHIFTLIFIGYKCTIAHKLVNYDDYHLFATLGATELSSFFYVFRFWLADDNSTVSKLLSPKLRSVVKKVNDGLFYLSFFKLRIYDFTKYIMLNEEGFGRMEKYTEGRLSQQVFLYFGVVGLYVLNIYWFAVLTKVVFKPLVKSALDPKTAVMVNERLTSLLHWITIPAAVYNYSKSPSQSYILDTFGLIGLSMASYEYHSTSERMIQTKNEIISTSYELIDVFAADQLSIHLRSFLCAATALYYSPNWRIIYVPAAFHLGTSIATIHYLHNLKKTDQEARYYPEQNDTHKQFSAFVKAATSLPIALDVFIVAMCSHSGISAVKFVTVSCVCVIILTVNPFYELNHSVFHLGMIAQAYFASQCNLR